MLWIDYAYDVQRALQRDDRARRPARTRRRGRSRDDPRFRDDVAGFYVDAQALLADGLPRLLEVHAGQGVAGALAAQALRQRDVATSAPLRQ